MIRALIVDRGADGGTATRLDRIEESDLPEGDVTVEVSHSTLNYKDALALTGKAPIIRSFPLVPGIDFAGRVKTSAHDGFKPGDAVVLNGWGLGETRHGGYAAAARVPGDWLVRLPESFTPEQAMAVGTAGYTAMLCLLRLEELGVEPSAGPVLVTGATGGVGSVALMLLAKRGFEPHALTGRPEEEPYLRDLGAAGIVPRGEYAAPGKPLAKERWAGGIDAVGSHVLANLLAATKRGGAVAACGLAGGMNLPTNVAPFILRGVTLAGIDSVYAPLKHRKEAWRRLAQDLDPAKLAAATRTVGLSEVEGVARDLLEGRVRGRVVVDIAG